MDANEYQEWAVSKSVAHQSPADRMMNAVLGLCGEAGEVADHIKKVQFQGHAFKQADMEYELGDILWYVALACDAMDTTMAEIMELNQRKLNSRYPQGFSVEASINRAE